jgi:hypothetical protein
MTPPVPAVAGVPSVTRDPSVPAWLPHEGCCRCCRIVRISPKFESLTSTVDKGEVFSTKVP